MLLITKYLLIGALIQTVIIGERYARGLPQAAFSEAWGNYETTKEKAMFLATFVASFALAVAANIIVWPVTVVFEVINIIKKL